MSAPQTSRPPLAWAQIGETLGSLRDLIPYVFSLGLALLQQYVNLDRFWNGKIFWQNACGVLLWLSLIVGLYALLRRVQVPSTIQPNQSLSRPWIVHRGLRLALWGLAIGPALLICLRALLWFGGAVPAESQQFLLRLENESELVEEQIATLAHSSVEQIRTQYGLPPILLRSYRKANFLERQGAEFIAQAVTSCNDSKDLCKIYWNFSTGDPNHDAQFSFNSSRTEGQTFDATLKKVIELHLPLAQCATLNYERDYFGPCHRLLFQIAQERPVVPDLNEKILSLLGYFNLFVRERFANAIQLEAMPIFQTMGRSQQILLLAAQANLHNDYPAAYRLYLETESFSCEELQLSGGECQRFRQEAAFRKAEALGFFDGPGEMKLLRDLLAQGDTSDALKARAFREMANLKVLSNPGEALELAAIMEAHDPDSFSTKLFLARLHGHRGDFLRAFGHSLGALLVSRGNYAKGLVANSVSVNLKDFCGPRCGLPLDLLALRLIPHPATFDNLASSQSRWRQYHAALMTAENGLALCTNLGQPCPKLLEVKAISHAKLRNREAAEKTFLALEAMFTENRKTEFWNGEYHTFMRSAAGRYYLSEFTGVEAVIKDYLAKPQ